MNPTSLNLQQSIASNKFYPPRINQSQSLLRHTIIARRLPGDLSSKRIIVVEAQAGQGKTTLVHQYLDYCQHPYIWYQVGSEDNDPVLLLSALQLALSRKFDTFNSPQLTAILEKGLVGPMDLQGCANILLNDIDTYLDSDTFIVFDDMHLISESPLTNQLLDYLIDTSPPQLHFIFTSRHPLQLNAQQLTRNPLLTYLDTDDLALDTNDIENLYRSVFEMDLSKSEVEEIFNVTNGWIMGIVLAANPFSTSGKKQHAKKPSFHDKSKLLKNSKDGYILSYFEDEIFSHVPEKLHSPFLKLSFLDEIDVNLARTLTSIDNIDCYLDQMADENFFVYRLDDEKKVFRFHHLFQEFLQILGRKSLDSAEISSIFGKAADYYMEFDLTEKALKALRNGEDFGRMETILQTRGLQLVSANRTVTILGILQSIPEKIVLEHSWLSFFYGLLATDFTPRLTLPFFESCRSQFASKNQEAGELMSLSQIIYFHFVISGNYHTGSKLLERTQILFERNHHKLPVEITILVARNLAAGYCFFNGEMESARHYAQMGCDLATKRDSRNFIASTRFILGYIGLLSGDTRTARNETEKSYSLAGDPLVGMSNRLTLYIMQLCQLSMHGDFPGFLHHKDIIQANMDQKVVRQTVAAPYLYVWSSVALIGTGRTAEAIDIIEHGMLASQTAAIDHMTSQFLQWRGFAHSLSGNRRQTLADIEASTTLREKSGGPFYIAFNLAIAGASFALLGETDKARIKLTRGLTLAKNISSSYLKACCLAYLALIDVLEENLTNIPISLREWLQVMKENNYSYFWGWEPKCMTRLLSTAVKCNIEADFAIELARKRTGVSILPDGTPIPLLTINTLGDFSVGTQTGKLLGPQDFSHLQRELFGLLISSPDQRISQEQVQLVFWPDSHPDKARKSFDTLMYRLRKVFDEKLLFSSKPYINIEKGYVQLTNTTVDAINFMKAARTGLKHCKQGWYWQAGNKFTDALSCWKHFLPTETFISDQAVGFDDDVQNTMKELCLSWCNMLSEHNQPEEALSILDKTSKILILDEDCVALRHRLYIKKHNPLKARDLLNQYRQELLRLDYTDEEADEIVSSITENRTIH